MNSRGRICAILSIALLAVPLAASAADVRTGDQLSTAAREKITQNLYLAGRSVTAAAPAPADEAIAGGTVLTSGPVTGDLLAAGGTITLLGPVSRNVRVAGGTVVVNGAVTGDVLAATGQATIEGGVGGDVIWMGGSMRIDGPVAGNLHLAGGDVVINAPVKGNVTMKGGKLTLGEKAAIGGNLTYSAQTEAAIPQGAVKGTVSYEPIRRATSTPEKSAAGALAALAALALVGKFLMTLACALVVGLILPRYAHAVVLAAIERPLAEIGRGFAVLVLTPVASVILLITVIGIPLGAIGLAAYVAMLILASILGAIILGSLVDSWVMRPPEYRVSWLTILVGAVLYALISLIPFVGGLVKFILVLLALGAAIGVKWNAVKEWR